MREHKCTLALEHQLFVMQMLGYTMPLFSHRAYEGHPQFMCTHEFLTPGMPVSEYHEPALALFKHCCEQAGIEATVVHRMALNITSYSPDKYGPIHRDHDFEHKNFVLYLNSFSNGSTFLFDEFGNITYECKAEALKAFCWDGQPHAQGFCDNHQRRAVFVATFS